MLEIQDDPLLVSGWGRKYRITLHPRLIRFAGYSLVQIHIPPLLGLTPRSRGSLLPRLVLDKRPDSSSPDFSFRFTLIVHNCFHPLYYIIKVSASLSFRLGNTV